MLHWGSTTRVWRRGPSRLNSERLSAVDTQQIQAATVPVRILVDMHAALDTHAGIPQETRLLFRGLSLVESFAVEGLIQSPGNALCRGLPEGRGGWFGRRLPADQEIDRLARVVIMLEQKFLRSHLAAIPMVLRRCVGLSEALTRFEARHFRDFIWQRLFARTLTAADFEVVTRANYRVARVPRNVMHDFGFVSGTLGHALYPRVDTRSFDVFISQTPYPGTVSNRTRLIVRYHDAVPLLLPHTISDRHRHQVHHYRALRLNVRDGAWFACPSDATRRDLLSVFPEAERRAVTIHNIVSHDYFDEASAAALAPEVIKSRFNDRIPALRDIAARRRELTDRLPVGGLSYLLAVSTIEPRKNHLLLLSAWERLRVERFPDLKLVLVGAPGWHHEAIIAKLRPWLERGELFMLEDVPSAELRLLYKHARATVCPSIGEGFGYSGVEAMKCGGAVVASDLPVHREIYSRAAEYFNPYSVAELQRALAAVIDPQTPARRAELVEAGAEISQRYASEAILPQWREFLAGTDAGRAA